MSETQEATCDLCGAVSAEDDGAAAWIHLEVTRWSPVAEDVQFHDVGFCSQAHAAEWLARPLPDPEPAHPVPVSSWGDRLALGGCFAGLVLVLGLVLVGLRVTVSFLTGRL